MPGQMHGLASQQRVEITGLNSKPELNGRCGTVVCDVAARLAVLLDGGSSTAEPILVKPANLVPREPRADGDTSSIAAAKKLSERAVALAATPAEARRSRRELATLCAGLHHAWRLEAATHAAAVEDASSRSELPDEVWDRVVELQQGCQRAANTCHTVFAELLKEAIDADDARCWSCSGARYARFLTCEPAEASVLEGKKLAAKVLDVHACGRKCADALFCYLVVSSDEPVAASASNEFVGSAPDECPLLAADAWATVCERDRMQRELQASWDDDTRKRTLEKEAKAKAEAVAQVGVEV